MSQDLPVPANAKIDLTSSKYVDVTVPATPDDATFGYVYKKAASDGLYWLTEGGGEVDLTATGGISSFGTAAEFNGNEVAIPNSTKAGTSSLTTVGVSANAACNTAFGYGTLYSVPDTVDVGGFTAMGYNAGGSIADGAYSIFTGSNCAPLMTSSNSDIFIGSDLATTTTAATGGGNVVIGSGSLVGTNFTGSSNVFVGTSQIGNDAGSASNNVVLGVNAGFGLHDGIYNILIGAGAGISMTNGNSCIAIGASALSANVTTVGLVGIGPSALQQATGVGNTGLGFQAGSVIVTGTNNTIVGYNANVSTNSFSNCIVMGASSRANATGQIRIGFSNVQATVQSNTFIDGINGSTVDPGTSAAVLVDTLGKLGTISSSKRYKYDIQDVSPNVIDRLFEMSPKTFKYKEDPKNTSTYGLIAEDIRDLIPDIVIYSKDADGNRITDKDGYRVETIQYHLLVPLLVGAVRELKREITELRQMNV